MLPNTTTRAQGLSRSLDNSPTTLTAKLEIARRELGRAFLDVQAAEGRLLDYETADSIACALLIASRELKELTLQVAVMERKVS
jgi:hypothetical protein